MGTGTPSQRQQQYMQTRAAQAAQKVMEHKLSGLQDKGNALSVQDRQRVAKTKTRYEKYLKIKIAGKFHRVIRNQKNWREI